MYHTTAAAGGIDDMLPTTSTLAAALADLGCVQRHERRFGEFRPSTTSPTRLDTGSSRVKYALLAGNARSTERPTDLRQPYSSTPHTNLLQIEHKTTESIGLTITRSPRKEMRSEQSSVGKYPFRLMGPTAIIGFSAVFVLCIL